MGGDGGCVPQRADIVKTAGYDFLRSQTLGGLGTCANTIVQKGTEDGAGEIRNNSHKRDGFGTEKY